MAQRFNPNQFALFKSIDNILWSKWDPIGINSVDAARDEYYSYLFPLMTMVINGENEDKIANYLYKCEINDMGLEGNIRHCRAIAALILISKPNAIRKEI